jgi:hypothetical protein
MFASLLNRIRSGACTDNDVAVKRERIICDDDSYPRDAIHIFAYNRYVNDHNTQKLDSLDVPKFTFVAQDSKKTNRLLL